MHMEKTSIQESLFGDQHIQSGLRLETQLKSISLEKELRENIKGRLLMSYALEKQRLLNENNFYNHKNVVMRFLSLLENNKRKALAAKKTERNEEIYEELGWRINSYELNMNENSNERSFSINLEFKEQEQDSEPSIISISFKKEDFSEIEFEDGELERDSFFDETVYVLENLIYENREE